MRKYLTEIIVIVLSFLVISIVLHIINPSLDLSRKVMEPTLPEPKMVWCFPADSVVVDTFKVKPNQCLSDILSGNGVSFQTIDLLAHNASGVFDVKKVKAGNNYYFVSTKGAHQPSHFIYEESAANYYVLSLTDSCIVSKEVKQIDTIQRSASGIIESSLWNSFIDQGVNPNVCIALSDIFAWTVDFFGIQQGDRYKVIYDEYSVDGQFAGIGKIHAAIFENSGTIVPAYYFSSNGQEGFFDEKGNSLRKAFLKAPLNFSRISSRFSNSRMHPVLKIRRPHHGVDYAAPTGTPVYSIGDGVVVKKAYQAGGGGNYLSIKHNSVYTSQYMHLSKFANGIAAGARVKQGQLIGYVGMTGLASGPHLDFRMYYNGTPVDPLKVETPPVEPISESNKQFFAEVKDSLNKKLESVPYPGALVAKR